MDNVAGFLQAAAASAFLAKLIVDGIKIGIDLPRWGPVLLAFIAAQLAQFGLLFSEDAVLTRPTVAGAAITGVVAWGLAIGVTMAQTKGDRVEEKVDAALALPAGSTKADVEAKVKKDDSK